MMKKLRYGLCVLGTCFGISPVVQADVIGIKGSASAWQVKTQSGVEQLQHQVAPMLSLAVEHPLPILPNAKLRYVSLNQNDITNNSLQELQLQQSDAILYYELFDNVIEVDAGLAANWLQGEQQRDLNRETFSQIRPSVYASVAAKLPFTGFRAHTEALYGNSFGTRLSDIQAEIQYDVIDHPLLDIGAKLGYRMLNIAFSQDRLAGSTLEFTGSYIGVDVHF